MQEKKNIQKVWTEWIRFNSNIRQEFHKAIPHVTSITLNLNKGFGFFFIY